MPLFKEDHSKARPGNAIEYVTREGKAAYVTTRNLFEDRDYASQFEETAEALGKGRRYEERKYYHFKLSPDPRDDITPEREHAYAERLADDLFPGLECVIATHTDTKVVHSHIIVNAVDPLTGRKLHFSNADSAHMKDRANEIGREFGLTPMDFRKKSERKRTDEERHLILKGGSSWKEDLREVIEDAEEKAFTELDFEERLLEFGVRIVRSGKDYSYLHPERQKAIRGATLGERYTKEEIRDVIDGHFRERAEEAARLEAERREREHEEWERAHRDEWERREREERERERLAREREERERLERERERSRGRDGRSR